MKIDAAIPLQAGGVDMVDVIRKHAMRHYEDGWDWVVEAQTDHEIMEELGDMFIVGEAIAHYQELVDLETIMANDRGSQNDLFTTGILT